LAIDQLSNCRTNGDANNPGKRESRGAWPFDVAGAPMAAQVGKRICGDGKGAGADGDVWIADANNIEEERHSEDRTARANQSERESDRTARKIASLDPKISRGGNASAGL
jgi:hypothetical protein